VPLLSALTLLPLAGAVLLMAVPAGKARLLRRLALGIGVASLALAVVAFLQYAANPTGSFELVERHEWLPGLGVSFALGIDGITAPLVLLTGIVLFTGLLASESVAMRQKEYYVLFFTLVAGVFGTFASLDLFFLFFFYELAVLPMYLLIAVWGSTRKEYGALKLVLYLVAGSVLVWVALIALYVEGGLGTFDLRAYLGAAIDPSFQRLCFPFLMVGFGVLAGLWPFHTWSPDGHVAAPTAVSMLHAGVLMKLGAYGILRVGIQLLPEGAQAWAPLLMGLAIVNVLYGAFSAMGQRDLKFVIGYSSVSHMGYVLLGLATLNVTGLNGAVLQMFSHGIMTALFFAMVGVIYDRAHTRDIPLLGGLAKRMPIASSYFVVAGLASLGLPGLSGFAAELLVFIGAFQVSFLAGVLAVAGATVTAVYILRLLGGVFFGPLAAAWERLTEASPAERIGGAVLVAVLILFGVAPFLLLRVITTTVERMLGA